MTMRTSAGNQLAGRVVTAIIKATDVMIGVD
jgi:molybdopterin-binding protein